MFWHVKREGEMDIFESGKLVLFIIFVIPGFVSIKAYELFFPASSKEAADRIVDAIAYSCVNYSFLFLPIYLVEKNNISSNHFVFYLIFYVFVILGFPVLMAYAWKKMRESKLFQRNMAHPTEKPWDFVFSQRKSYWMKITLNDGRVIGGGNIQANHLLPALLLKSKSIWKRFG